MKRFAACLAIVLAPLITACSGGGGGGGGSSAGSSSDSSSGSSGSSGTPQPTQNLASISTPPQPWTFPATTLMASDSSGDTYNLSISNVAPSGTVTFDGQTADTAVLAIGLSENGAVIFLQDATVYYATNPFAPLGLAGSVNDVPYIATVTHFTPFPATLSVGSSGPVLSATYKNPAGVVMGELSETYTVTADSPTALDVNIDASATFNGAAIGQTITYSLSDTGSLKPTLAGVQLTVNDMTLTFH
jgi:hypothetical protein